MAGHVLHLAVESREQPVAKVRLIVGEIDLGDAHACKSQVGAPALDVRRQIGCMRGGGDDIVGMHRAYNAA